MRQVVLDTETTGLDWGQGHRVIEIGCIEILDRRITNSTFQRYINPNRAIEVGAQQVHGISAEFLEDKPDFSEIADDLIKFIEGAELIIHNAAFDVGFLNAEFDILGRDQWKIDSGCSIFDTLTFAREKHPGQRNSLDALCKRYEVDNGSRVLHGALLDASLLAEVYLAMTGGQTAFALHEDINVDTIHDQNIKGFLNNNFVEGIITPEEVQNNEDFLNKIALLEG